MLVIKTRADDLRETWRDSASPAEEIDDLLDIENLLDIKH